LQEDPDPGKLSSPITFNSKYIYANGNPMKYRDPNGRFALEIIYIAALIGGALGGYAAYNEASKVDGASSWQIAFSTILGVALGGASTALAVANPALAPLIVGGAAMLNNIGNQLIFNNKVSIGRAALSGAVAMTSTFILGTLLGPTFLSKEGQDLVGSIIGGGFGFCFDSGISKDEISVFCGITLNEQQNE
jgi:hypothetical protein